MNLVLRAIAPRGAPTRFRTRSTAIPDAEFVCQWPMCSKCVVRRQIVRLFLVAALVSAVVGIALCAGYPPAPDTYGPLALLGGISTLILVGASYSRLAVSGCALRMDRDLRWITMSTHPRFAAAVRSDTDREP